MRSILVFLLISTTLFSCSKDQVEEKASQPEDIQVMVYATHHNDTRIIAATPIFRVKLK